MNFSKLSGSGNDFIFLDAREYSPQQFDPVRITDLCARGSGIGADGLCFLGPGASRGAVRLVYFNADGSRGALCGNATLCATILAGTWDLCKDRGFAIETDSGPVRVAAAEDGTSVTMEA
ncbi:MAG: diaminopimelate epimerase, partial [Gemmatimonadales bacterium]